MTNTEAAARPSVLRNRPLAALLAGGSLLERLGPRRAMRLCDAVRAPLMLLVPVLHWTGELTLPILIALTFVIGAAGTPYGAAQRVVVTEILGHYAAVLTLRHVAREAI
jgi:hypothetical protein